MRLLLSTISIAFCLSLFSQKVILQESFNDTLMPAGWTTVASNNNNLWQVGIDAKQGSGTFSFGIQNIDGTPLLFFDDDHLGANSIDSIASITTASFDNSTDSITYLEFDYNFKEYVGIADSFIVDVFNGSSWNRVFSQSTDDCGHYTSQAQCGNGFPHALIDISAFKNTNCKVRFIYYDGEDWSWYVGLDNVLIWSVYPNDVQVTSINSINNGCLLSDSLTITLNNLGYLPATNFQIFYNLNGIIADSALFTDTIAELATQYFTFPNPTSINSGNNRIVAYTKYNLDQNKSNDSASLDFNSVNKYNLPYQEGFETTNHNWSIGGTNSSWAIGTPNGSMIDTSSEGTKAAVTNLNGVYNSSELSYLTSPCISIGPSTTEIKVSFDLIYEIESTYDETWLEYSYDGGISWTKVLRDSLYRGKHWYNIASTKVWNGTRNSWLQSTVFMRNLIAGSVMRFRIAFHSDATTQLEGVGIDNFMVDEISNTDLSISSILNPTTNSICGASREFISLELENLGKSTISNGTLFYQVNGGTVFSDTISTAISAGMVETFQFNQPFDFSILSNPNLKVWINIPGDSVSLNDTAQITISNTASSATYSTPYFQDFDLMNVGSPPNQGWTVNNFVSFGGWTSSNIATNSNYTGPTGDATGVVYWYLETSTTLLDDPILESPCIYINSATNLFLDYSYHMYGADMGTLYVDLLDSNTWVGLDSINGQQQTSSSAPWITRRIDLSSINSRTIKIRFRGRETNGNGVTSDMAIDDIKIRPLDGSLLYLEDLKAFNTSCNSTSPSQFTFNLEKDFFGSLNKDSLTFELYQNGTLVSTEQLTSDLNSILVDTIILLNYSPSINQFGTANFELKSTFIKDGITYRDSLNLEVTNAINQLPYSFGFEENFTRCHTASSGFFLPEFIESNGWYVGPSTSLGWHVSDTSRCQFNNNTATVYQNTGPPYAKDSSAFVYWNYNRNGTVSYLITPCFDLSNYNQAELSFWYHRYQFVGSSPSDMGQLKLEAYDGQTWQLISRIDTAWPTNNEPWIKETVDITNYTSSNIQFRFKVDSSLGFLNTAIDAFEIIDPLSVNIEKSNPNSHSLTLYPNPNLGSFTVRVAEKLIGSDYEIVDINGRQINSSRFISNRAQIDLEDVDKGIYFLRIRDQGVIEKIVVY